MLPALTELEIGLVAWSLALVIFGIQGLLSVALEGRELRPGRIEPRLTDPLSVAIAVFAVALLAISALLGVAILSGWPPTGVGTLAGAGCLILGLLLVLYKEAFVGDEAALDERDDGIPW